MEYGPAHPWVLAIYMADSAGGYRLECLARRFLGNDQGGRQGRTEEPSITINDKGILQIFIDGPHWHPWYLTYKFRYQKGGFYLIGLETVEYHNIALVDMEDYNLSTGRAVCRSRVEASEAPGMPVDENGNAAITWDERRRLIKRPRLDQMDFVEQPSYEVVSQTDDKPGKIDD